MERINLWSYRDNTYGACYRNWLIKRKLAFSHSNLKHDLGAHILLMNNPHTLGGELRGLICQGVFEGYFAFREIPTFNLVISFYQRAKKSIEEVKGLKFPILSSSILQKWYEIAVTKLKLLLVKLQTLPSSYEVLLQMDVV